MDVRGWARSDPGTVRDVNQDHYFLGDEAGLFAVADGIGGKREGGRASRILTQRLEDRASSLARLARESDPETEQHYRERVLRQLQDTIQHANAAIFQQGDGSMGTTVDALLLAGEVGFIAHVGDSRIYLVRDEHIFQLTDDHTFAEKLKRERSDDIDRGELNVAQFEHVLTRSIGSKPHVDVDTLFVDVQPGDRFLLCSDGLSDGLDESEMLEAMSGRGGRDVATSLVERAKDADGTDNITALMVDVSTDDEAETEQLPPIDTLRKVSFLEQIELFEGLDQQDLVKILRILYKQIYRDGEYVVRRGEVGDRFFMIVEGEISVQMEGSEVTRLGAGAHFGEFALLDEGSERSADAVAVGETVLLAVPADQFWELVEHREPELGNQLLRNLLGHATDRLRETTERMMFETS